MKTSPASIGIALWLSLVGMTALPASGQTPETEIVDASSVVLDEIMAIPIQSIPVSLLNGAEGVAIMPGMLKGGFVVGIRHGRGTLMLRGPNGVWQPPQFVSITGGSIGWQIGIQATDLVLVFKTPNSIRGLLRGKLTLGADIAAAAGPVGRQATAATDAALRAEIYSYSRSRGLFAGVALDGSVVQIDPLAASYYYGTPQPPTAQPGLAVNLPVSSVELLKRINHYAGPGNTAAQPQVLVPAGPTVAQPTLLAPPELETIRQQLGESASRLHALIDDHWKRYLAMPADLYSPDRKPSDEDLATVLRHYDQVAQSPSYRTLTDRPEFRATYDLLRRYWAARHAAAPATMSLPAPPAAAAPRR